MVVLLAGPEGGAAPSLMLEYQKSRRRRTALGLFCVFGSDALQTTTELDFRRHQCGYQMLTQSKKFISAS
jgi:hypothetical protein